MMDYTIWYPFISKKRLTHRIDGQQVTFLSGEEVVSQMTIEPNVTYYAWTEEEEPREALTNEQFYEHLLRFEYEIIHPYYGAFRHRTIERLEGRGYYVEYAQMTAQDVVDIHTISVHFAKDGELEQFETPEEIFYEYPPLLEVIDEEALKQQWMEKIDTLPLHVTVIEGAPIFYYDVEKVAPLLFEGEFLDAWIEEENWHASEEELPVIEKARGILNNLYAADWQATDVRRDEDEMTCSFARHVQNATMPEEATITLDAKTFAFTSFHLPKSLQRDIPDDVYTIQPPSLARKRLFEQLQFVVRWSENDDKIEPYPSIDYPERLDAVTLQPLAEERFIHKEVIGIHSLLRQMSLAEQCTYELDGETIKKDGEEAGFYTYDETDSTYQVEMQRLPTDETLSQEQLFQLGKAYIERFGRAPSWKVSGFQLNDSYIVTASQIDEETGAELPHVGITITLHSDGQLETLYAIFQPVVVTDISPKQSIEDVKKQYVDTLPLPLRWMKKTDDYIDPTDEYALVYDGTVNMSFVQIDGTLEKLDQTEEKQNTPKEIENHVREFCQKHFQRTDIQCVDSLVSEDEHLVFFERTHEGYGVGHPSRLTYTEENDCVEGAFDSSLYETVDLPKKEIHVTKEEAREVIARLTMIRQGVVFDDLEEVNGRMLARYLRGIVEHFPKNRGAVHMVDSSTKEPWIVALEEQTE